MRVVLYNYLQPEDGGGGVGVYMGNLAAALAEQGHEVAILNAGDRYTLFRRSPRLKVWRDAYQRIEILNSPVVAPAYYSFDDPDGYLDGTGLDPLAPRLRARLGPVDAFHFQNFEGLTIPFVRALKVAFPEARFIYSAHNYHAVCPSVHLWRRDRELCLDNRGGAACADCIEHPSDSRAVMRWRGMSAIRTTLDRFPPGIEAGLKRAKRGLYRVLRRPGAAVAQEAAGQDAAASRPAGTGYHRWRKAHAALCRDVLDCVLAVSGRTRDICVAYGLPAEKVDVVYIGTRHKAAFDGAKLIRALEGDLHVAYLGYMRIDKGFGFLLDVLERMPAELAGRLRLTVAARRDREGVLHPRLASAASRLRGLRVFDGFTHETLDEVLDGVNLGLVPPLWEDNLPQVAIEIVSRGIPVLTSDRGGAREIGGKAAFTFEGGSIDGLVERLGAIADGRVRLGDFWDGGVTLQSMAEHVAELLPRYAGVSAARGLDRAA